MRPRFLVLAMIGAACAEPTAMRVSVFSEIPCDTQAEVSLSVAGDATALANALPSAEATECTDVGGGTFARGSVVLAPHDDKGKTIAFQLTTRNDGQPTSTCATDFASCIVARRQLRFQPGSEIKVRVDLRRSCLGVVCPGEQTCVKGQCVTAVLPPCTDCGEPLVADGPASTAQALEVCGDRSGTQAGAPWPLAYGCPTNSGRTSASPPATGATLLAPTGTSENFRGATVASDGTVFLEEGNVGNSVAFDAATGAVKWSKNITSSGYVPALSIDRDANLYHSTNYGQYWSLDTAGNVRWQKQELGVLAAMTIAAPGVGYFGSQGYGFYAVNIPDGTRKWHVDLADSADTSLASAVAGDTVYAVDRKNSLVYALATADGATRFKVPVNDTVNGSPVVGPTALFVGTQQRGLVALDLATGAEKWHTTSPSLSSQPALLSNGDVVAVGPDGGLFVVDPATGALKSGGNATDAGTARLRGGPIVFVDDTVVYSTDRGTFAVRGTTQVWQSPLAGAVAPADHRVIVMPIGSGAAYAIIGP